MSLTIIPMRFVIIPKEIQNKIASLYHDKDFVFVESFDNQEFLIYNDQNKKEFLSSISLEKEYC